MSDARLLINPQSGNHQTIITADLRSYVPGGVTADIVYVDPPWNPATGRYFSQDSGPYQFEAFLDSLCEHVSLVSGTKHILCEQSAIALHRDLFESAVARCGSWRMPMINEYSVRYGRLAAPGLNVLLHYGVEPLTTDPSGLHGADMTREVFRGLGPLSGKTVFDPCVGLGMTSRMAHEFGMNCVGIELRHDRAQRTIQWLERRGYEDRGK